MSVLRTQHFLRVRENLWQLVSLSLLPPNRQERPRNTCPFSSIPHTPLVFSQHGCVCGWTRLHFKRTSRSVANGNRDPASLYHTSSESGKCNRFPEGDQAGEVAWNSRQPGISGRKPTGAIHQPWPQPTHPHPQDCQVSIRHSKGGGSFGLHATALL